MACLDPFDPRGNRASVGQILGTLKDPALANLFATGGQGSTTALQQARRSYKDLQKCDWYKRVKRLRDKAVGHILNTPAPEVEYQAIYELRDGAGQIITNLMPRAVVPPGRVFFTTALRRSNTQRFSGIPIFWGWDCFEQSILGKVSRRQSAPPADGRLDNSGECFFASMVGFWQAGQTKRLRSFKRGGPLSSTISLTISPYPCRSHR